MLSYKFLLSYYDKYYMGGTTCDSEWLRLAGTNLPRAAASTTPCPSSRSPVGRTSMEDTSKTKPGPSGKDKQLLDRLGSDVRNRILRLLSSGYNNGCSEKPSGEGESYQSIYGDLPKNCFETVLWTLGIRGHAPIEEEFDHTHLLPRLEANGYHARPNSIPLFTINENRVATGARPIPPGLIPGDVLLFGSLPTPNESKYYFTQDFPERRIHASPEEKARAENIWEALKTAGYIDRNGFILPKFTGKLDNFNIGIDLTPEEQQRTLFILNSKVESAREHPRTYHHGAIYLGERDGKHYIFQKPSWNCGPQSPYQITTIEAYNSRSVGQPVDGDYTYDRIFIYRKQNNGANLTLNPGSAFHFTNVIPSSLGLSRQF